MFNERMNRAYDYGYEDGLARGTECGYKRGYENGKKSEQTDKERLSRMTNQEAIEILSKWDGVYIGYSSDEVNEAHNKAIKALEQEPKTGHWIEHDMEDMREKGYYRCSVCGTGYQRFVKGIRKSDVPYIDGQEYTLHNIDNYCPNCGAKMVEPQESETWNGIHAQITAPKGTFEQIFNEADDDNDI